MTQADDRRVRRAAGAAYGVLALADAALAAGPHRRARLVTKPLLMPMLVTRSLRSPGGPAPVTAQACSWGGDLALMGTGRGRFLTGVAMFLAAHVAYVSAFRSRSSAPVLASGGRRRFLAVGGLAAGAMALAAGREDRVLAAPIAVYGTALATMVAAAAAVDEDRGRDRVLGGAALFLVSDVLLGVRTFLVGEDGEPSVLEGAVMATYTAGQWLIGDGLTRP
jgi:uncharacterized membrane protein YhhN